MSLAIERSLQQLEVLLRDTIALGLKKRLPTAATAAELRARKSLGNSGTPVRRERDLVFVTEIGKVFSWSQSSTATDDGETVIKPDDSTGPGRWLVATSQVRLDGNVISEIENGILEDVVLHNGDFSLAALDDRVFGRAPCVAIHFVLEKHDPISIVPGALYNYSVEFEIWSVSRSFRDLDEAAVGSPVAAESAKDPGVLRVHGLVKQLLAGQDLGESGIKYIELGEGRIEISDLEERLFVMALGIQVYGSIHNADNPAELVAVEGIDVQRYETQLPADGSGYDEDNAVTLGLSVSLGIGFAKTIEAGSAKIGGVAVTANALLKTFTADIDTYRDLMPDGTWVFTEVAHGATPNAPVAGNLRVGVTVTDSIGVVADDFLCTESVPREDPDAIELT